jgi:hypothetical protein
MRGVIAAATRARGARRVLCKASWGVIAMAVSGRGARARASVRERGRG